MVEDADAGADVAGRFRRILVAYDGSAHSGVALNDAVAVARRDRATLTVMCVVRPLRIAVLLGGVATASVAADQERKDAASAMRGVGKRIPAEIPYTTVIRFGDPVVQILWMLAEQPYDVVFMGTGRRWRSISRRILARTTVEVRVSAGDPEQVGTSPWWRRLRRIGGRAETASGTARVQGDRA